MAPRDTTSFPGSLLFPPPSLAPGGGKRRDPGNEVARDKGLFAVYRVVMIM